MTLTATAASCCDRSTATTQDGKQLDNAQNRRPEIQAVHASKEPRSTVRRSFRPHMFCSIETCYKEPCYTDSTGKKRAKQEPCQTDPSRHTLFLPDLAHHTNQERLSPEKPNHPSKSPPPKNSLKAHQSNPQLHIIPPPKTKSKRNLAPISFLPPRRCSPSIFLQTAITTKKKHPHTKASREP